MISTDINIKISVDDGVDITNPKDGDKIKIDISHDDCGNGPIDDFADNLSRLINHVIESCNDTKGR